MFIHRIVFKLTDILFWIPLKEEEKIKIISPKTLIIIVEL